MSSPSRTRRVISSLREHGVHATLLKAHGLVTDHLFDLSRGVETRAWRELDGLTIVGDQAQGKAYQAVRVRSLRKVLASLAPEHGAGSVLVDLGCGKGRVLLVAAELGFPEVRGVEFAAELCEVARRNCARYIERHRPQVRHRVVHADAATYPIAAEENLFFMFNPFADAVMRRVLDNIHASCVQHSRPAQVLYHGVPGASLIDRDARFRCEWRRPIAGMHFFLYSTGAARRS